MSNQFTLRQRLLLFFAGRLGPLLIRLLGATWRVKVAGQSDVYPQRKKTKRMIYCFWHNRLLGLCYTQRNKNVGILISSHFDGEIIARIVSRMGYHPLRGSTTRGGALGLMSMLKNEDVWHLSVTVDGPRGPKGVSKPGAIFLAAKTGLPIIPISCDSSKKWVLKSWDRLEIPKPFARVVISTGQPIYIKDAPSDEQIQKHTLELAERLNEIGNCS